MRRPHHFGWAFLLTALGCDGSAPPGPPPDDPKAMFDRVRPGMTEAEVEAVLGKPSDRRPPVGYSIETLASNADKDARDAPRVDRYWFIGDDQTWLRVGFNEAPKGNAVVESVALQRLGAASGPVPPPKDEEKDKKAKAD